MAFWLDASCAVDACVTTLNSTRAKSGLTDTVDCPNARTKEPRIRGCAHNPTPKQRKTTNELRNPNVHLQHSDCASFCHWPGVAWLTEDPATVAAFSRHCFASS